MLKSSVKYYPVTEGLNKTSHIVISWIDLSSFGNAILLFYYLCTSKRLSNTRKLKVGKKIMSKMKTSIPL